MQYCKGCQKNWFKPDSLDSWYGHLRTWIADGKCEDAPEGIDVFHKAIDRDKFLICANKWVFLDSYGQNYQEYLKPRYLLNMEEVSFLYDIFRLFEYIIENRDGCYEACQEFLNSQIRPFFDWNEEVNALRRDKKCRQIFHRGMYNSTESTKQARN